MEVGGYLALLGGGGWIVEPGGLQLRLLGLLGLRLRRCAASIVVGSIQGWHSAPARTSAETAALAHGGIVGSDHGCPCSVFVESKFEIEDCTIITQMF